MFNCGICGQSISISTELYFTASLSDLQNLCLEYDYAKYSNSPFYDSVLEGGEYKRSEKDFVEEDNSDIDEEIIFFETED